MPFGAYGQGAGRCEPIIFIKSRGPHANICPSRGMLPVESQKEGDMGQKKESETQLKASKWLHSVVLVRLRSKKGEREREALLWYATSA